MATAEAAVKKCNDQELGRTVKIAVAKPSGPGGGQRGGGHW